MSTHHRGLPPMTLPQPPQPPQQVVPALNQPTGPLQLPAPPQQWQGAEESMRNWLQAKAEEDKRKQEEEKTRQESLRLEQRKIEQDMLRTSLAGGIPPYMIPMVFAGMGGGNLPSASIEWAQHYMAQAHQLQQHQLQQRLVPGQSQHTSPEQLQRGDSRPTFGGQHPAPATVPSTPHANITGAIRSSLSTIAKRPAATGTTIFAFDILSSLATAYITSRPCLFTKETKSDRASATSSTSKLTATVYLPFILTDRIIDIRHAIE
ncbi:hypothetical protein SS1G_05706 [Sclerotinia sclerotiorum 1980 UF-70]|uniref:Uncharacterized protein n=1 Tax=Sclerotinia sclerotiorum (strain ATCC 18683 / 1980 / Ss-1) TaxID=665079 RepID=A7EK60_SCLS1|nr:hypothetical protein SS1G_05706 [Sclerotinia sclerotiorum 1980 UF-70]EDO03226.1 hypothetical protein SS1G_05706 [Sclerotinia sclerotiorum 1980 UF-70]